MDVWRNTSVCVVIAVLFVTLIQRRRLEIEGVVEVMRRGRLRWFGHVERKEVDI